MQDLSLLSVCFDSVPVERRVDESRKQCIPLIAYFFRDRCDEETGSDWVSQSLEDSENKSGADTVSDQNCLFVHLTHLILDGSQPRL